MKQFHNFFVFKRFHDDVLVHYFSSRFLKGAINAADFEPIEKPLKTETLGSFEKTRVIEEYLTTLKFEETKGEWSVYFSNFNKLT